jgi:hypothetical protein
LAHLEGGDIRVIEQRDDVRARALQARERTAERSPSQR